MISAVNSSEGSIWYLVNSKNKKSKKIKADAYEKRKKRSYNF